MNQLRLSTWNDIWICACSNSYLLTHKGRFHPFYFVQKKNLFMCSITIYCYVVVHNEDGGLCINVCLVA